MRDEQPALMWRVWIDVIDVGACEGLDEALLVPPAMPFAANPTDLGQTALFGERLEDRVLGALTVELQEVDVGEAELSQSLPERRGCDRRHRNPEVAVTGVEVFPQFNDVLADAAVRDGRGQQALAVAGGDGGVNSQELRLRDMGRVALQELEAVGMGLDRDDFRLGPPLVAEHREAADVGADVEDRARVTIAPLLAESD